MDESIDRALRTGMTFHDPQLDAMRKRAIEECDRIGISQTAAMLLGMADAFLVGLRTLVREGGTMNDVRKVLGEDRPSQGRR